MQSLISKLYTPLTTFNIRLKLLWVDYLSYSHHQLLYLNDTPKIMGYRGPRRTARVYCNLLLSLLLTVSTHITYSSHSLINTLKIYSELALWVTHKLIITCDILRTKSCVWLPYFLPGRQGGGGAGIVTQAFVSLRSSPVWRNRFRCVFS